MPTLHEIKADFFSLAAEYPGKWVALHPTTMTVLNVGSSAKEVADAALAAGFEDAVITRVAEDYSVFVSCAHA